jgi:UDP-glucose:(heptosyl)LPS alpha-1,3-glucosyltransferase
MRAQLNFTDEVTYLFAASNPRLKGLTTLLESFAQALARRPGLRLVVIGKEAEPAALRRAKQLRITDAVRFAGRVEDTLPYFAAADVFVLPTYYDACSLSVLEACACGLPVITTAQNGAADLLADGREGCILKHAGDGPALTEAILRMADFKVRADAGGRALELASRCTFERNVEEIEKVYRESLARRTR